VAISALDCSSAGLYGIFGRFKVQHSATLYARGNLHASPGVARPAPGATSEAKPTH